MLSFCSFKNFSSSSCLSFDRVLFSLISFSSRSFLHCSRFFFSYSSSFRLLSWSNSSCIASVPAQDSTCFLIPQLIEDWQIVSQAARVILCSSLTRISNRPLSGQSTATCRMTQSKAWLQSSSRMGQTPVRLACLSSSMRSSLQVSSMTSQREEGWWETYWMWSLWLWLYQSLGGRMESMMSGWGEGYLLFWGERGWPPDCCTSPGGSSSCCRIFRQSSRTLSATLPPFHPFSIFEFIIKAPSSPSQPYPLKQLIPIFHKQQCFPPAIQFYYTMTQKLKVAKSIKNIDAYSKNPIIDSLIKQKLQSEMKSVKDNFQQMIKQSQEKIKPHHIRPLRKRTLSVQDLSTLQPQKIRNSLHYNPAAANQTIAFLTQRQTGSPFFQNSQIQELNRARTNNQQFFVRLNQSDKLNLQQLPNNDPAFYQSLQGKAKQKLPSDLWLPSLPEVDNIVTSRLQRLQQGQKSQSKLFNFETTGRPSSDGFNPLRSYRAKSSRESQKDSNGPEITYEHKKYHKGDYQSLQKWLEIAVDFINEQARKEQSTDQGKPKEHLNQIYTIYMCAIRQLIRLTYIESGEKGLILEKVVWSMVRLFQELLREQHKLNFGDFKYFSTQIEQERQMYTERMRKLERKVQEQEEIVTEYLDSKRKIVLTGFSFKKVNEEMHRQIHTLLEQIRNLNKQNDFLMQNLLKLIHEFQSRDQIKLQKTQEHNVYFYLNDKNKPQVVARVPTHDDLQRHFQQEMKRNVIKDDHFESKNHAVGKLDNELTSYWERKMMYLDVHGIVREHFSCHVQDVGIHVDGKGPSQFLDMAVQHPDKEEESFQNFLKKQLEEEREYWEKKEGEYVQSQITLKDLYNQMKESIDILTSQNVGLKSQIEPKDHQIHFQNKKIEQLQERVELFSKKIQMLESTIDKHIDQEKKFIEEIKDLKEKLADQKKQFLFQKQNNNLLASSLFQIKDKNERIAKQFDDLEEKIKAVAPHLQEVMSLPETSQHLTLMNLAAAVERNLSEYVERDAKVFLTH